MPHLGRYWTLTLDFAYVCTLQDGMFVNAKRLFQSSSTEGVYKHLPRGEELSRLKVSNSDVSDGGCGDGGAQLICASYN